MALIHCRECGEKISDQAFDCPKCGAKLKKPKRTAFGKIVKFLFIAFNILMIFWFFSYSVDVSEMQNAATSDAERAGVVMGAGIGVGVLMVYWVLGDIILGMLVLLTRPKK